MAELQRRVVELENNQDVLEQEVRCGKCMLEEYEQRVQHTLEELAMVQTECEQARETTQEQVQRLNAQLRDTQDELLALQQKKKRHREEEELRMSRLSVDCSSRLALSRLELNAEDSLSRARPPEKGHSFRESLALVNDMISSLEGQFKKTKKRPS
jgi:hypothetical protein